MSLPPDPRARWSRNAPPLVVSVAAIAALAMILPSALRVPQQDPTPVLEFAPVPPQDDAPQANDGNLSSLALGSSSTTQRLVNVTPPPPPPGDGSRPPGKPCVTDPETGETRQSIDPMAPQCAPYFQGDNGGETWQGVSEDEIRVLVYVDGANTSYNNEPSPGAGIYIDLDQPPLPPCPKGTNGGGTNKCDHQIVRQTRALANYFNRHFQTYDRRAHFWVYFNDGQGSVTSRRAEAHANWDTIRPFAVLDQATFNGNNQAYQDAIAARGVLVFTSETALPNAFYRKFPSFAWGFWPDVEHWSDLYASYVCQTLVGRPATRMGNPPGTDPRNGQTRKFGLFFTTDQKAPGLIHFAKITREKLRKCGIPKDAPEGFFPESRFAVNPRDTGKPQADAVAKFQAAGVTTVLYLGGVEGKFSHLADKAGYYPEIVIADDLFQGNNVTAREQNPTVWQNAWAVHFQVRFDDPLDSPGYAAYRESYPGAPEDEARYVNEIYRDHFMLFQAIQVAGPRLSPEQVDKGFHAIPPKKSSRNPYEAACYFDPGDYSCVKDATVIWWDPTGVSAGDGKPGCWRYAREGRRFQANRWPGTLEVFDPDDACGGYDAARRARLG